MSDVATQLKAIQDEIGQTWEEMKTRLAERDEDAVDKATIENLNTAITDLRDQQSRLEAEQKRARLRDDVIDEMEREDDPEKLLQRSAFDKYLRYGDGDRGRTMMDDEEKRALADSNDPDGGFFSPAVMESGVIRNAYDMAAIRPNVNTGTTSGSYFEVPKINKIAFAWGQQGVAVSDQVLNAGMERGEVEELTGLYRVANTTLEDASENVVAELTVMYGEGIAEQEDTVFATGDGVAKPQGIISDTRVQANYVPSGVAAALSDSSNLLYDTLIDLVQGLKTTYRANGRFAMNSLTEGEARKMKDDQNRPIWNMPVSAGTPAALLGYPIIVPEAMPDVAANAFPIVFGDFRRGYRVRDRRGLSVLRLVERFAEFRQTGYLVTKRVGGIVTLPEAFRCVKVATS